MDITLGTIVNELEHGGGVEMAAADSAMSHTLHTPWCRAYLSVETGPGSSHDPKSTDRLASLSEQVCARPIVVCGKSGGGKTSGSEVVLMQRLKQASVTVFDGKGEACRDMRALALGEGIDPASITSIDTDRPDQLPGLNPFLARVPAQHIAGDLVDSIEALTSGPAPRLRDIAYSSALLIAAHRLSPYDWVAFFQRPDFHAAVLRLPAPADAGAAFHQAVTFYAFEYASWAKSERASAVAPILNKIRSLVSSDPLLLLFSARTNTIDLESLFSQRQLLLISLNRATLGDTAARLATSILISGLYRTALRLQGRGTNPCTLFIDELPVIERLCGRILIDILSTGRSLKLPLMVALQHLGGISDDLRAALLGNSAALLSFALSYEDAHMIATALSAGREGKVERVSVRSKANKETGVEMASWSHTILDGNGQPLRLNASGCEALSKLGSGKAQLASLYEITRGCATPRLYVRDAHTGCPVELRQYVKYVSPSDYRVFGPGLSLSVFFPRPYVTSTTRTSASDLTRQYTKVIQDLRTQHCVACIGTDAPCVVRVADLSVPTNLEERSYIETDANEKVKALIDWRESEIERICRGKQPEGEPDGSIE